MIAIRHLGIFRKSAFEIQGCATHGAFPLTNEANTRWSERCEDSSPGFTVGMMPGVKGIFIRLDSFFKTMFNFLFQFSDMRGVLHGLSGTRATWLSFVVILMMLLLPDGACAQEICNNGVDDDGDMLIDLNDAANCACGAGAPANAIIPNPSFEEFTCVPNFFSQLDCAVGWVQATLGTSDFYLNVNGGFWPPSIPMPVPDGVGLGGFLSFGQTMGNVTFNTNEYLGTCLMTPMEAGVTYTLQLSVAGIAMDPADGTSGDIFFGALDITLFGSSECPPGGEWWFLQTDPNNPINQACP
ncbi:MAG: hypothetical protein ACK57W_12265, partial [Flavobacteriales bacterium]